MKARVRSEDERLTGRRHRRCTGVSRNWIWLLFAPLLGCAGGNMSDLEAYVNQVLARENYKIEPLPEVRPYEVYAYQSSDARDPFESFVQEEPEMPEDEVQIASGIRPDFNRNREELEAFPLDSLRMVGTVEKGDDIWGIILASEGTIYRVQVGNYIGRNHGKISNIEEDRLELTEIVPDGLGGWQERDASLALIE